MESREQRIATLAATLKSSGIARSDAQAKMMAEDMIGVEEHVQKNYEEKHAQAHEYLQTAKNLGNPRIKTSATDSGQKSSSKIEPISTNDLKGKIVAPPSPVNRNKSVQSEESDDAAMNFSGINTMTARGREKSVPSDSGHNTHNAALEAMKLEAMRASEEYAHAAEKYDAIKSDVNKTISKIKSDVNTSVESDIESNAKSDIEYNAAVSDVESDGKSNNVFDVDSKFKSDLDSTVESSDSSVAESKHDIFVDVEKIISNAGLKSVDVKDDVVVKDHVMLEEITTPSDIPSESISDDTVVKSSDYIDELYPEASSDEIEPPLSVEDSEVKKDSIEKEHALIDEESEVLENEKVDDIKANDDSTNNDADDVSEDVKPKLDAAKLVELMEEDGKLEEHTREIKTKPINVKPKEAYEENNIDLSNVFSFNKR